MEFEYRYHGSTAVDSSARATSMSFSPDTRREPTYFVGELGKCLEFREAISALHDVVVSDLRFSDDAPGQRAGQLFIDEVRRVHPEAQGLLYSAYPRPDNFPADRFIRKGGEATGGPTLADTVVRAVEGYLADPAVAAFVRGIADQGLIYQSESFGTTLAQIFGLARLLDEWEARGAGRTD